MISRNAGEEVRIFEDDRCCLVKVDIGAYGEEAFLEDSSGNVSLLAGEPLLALEGGESWQSRTRDLRLLHESWKNREESLIRKAQGVFCAAHYQPAGGTLSLIADKLGVRPLYYWIGEKYVAFATALRVLENLAEIPKEMDVRAVTEMICLGVPLTDRTPYTKISLLKAAEIIRISEQSVVRRQYWRWDDIAPSEESEPDLLRETYERFSQAVGRRIRQDKTTVAFLSGGMDSRCAVSALRDRNVQVHTFNFALRGTQDQIFGAEFARQAGAIHEEVPQISADPNWSQFMADVWSASKLRSDWPVQRPSVVWSGDGGSVGLGYVHITKTLVDLLRAGKTNAAIDGFLSEEATSIPRRLLKDQVFAMLSRSLHQGICEELDDIHHDDPARRFYTFLMLNDQRRHLAGHFENIDLHRLEFQLPFLDSDFLETVSALPVDLCLGHKFYTKWLNLFPPTTASVPWQTYPGHEPCPLPSPEGLTYQWDADQPKVRRESRRLELLRDAAGMLTADHFPDGIFERKNFRLALWASRLRVRDYGYLIEAARTYQRYWTICRGNFSIPVSLLSGRNESQFMRREQIEDDDQYFRTTRANLLRTLEDPSDTKVLFETVASLKVERVLDVGCGIGQALFPLAVRTGATGVGIDLSLIGCRMAGEFYANHLPDARVSFVRSRAESIPFESNSFDVVNCRLALPYTDNARAIAEFARVLRPGGLFLLKIHHARYYLHEFWQGLISRDPLAIIHAGRVLVAGTIYHVFRRQPRVRLLNETFQTKWLLRRELAKRELVIDREQPNSNPLTPDYVIHKKG